MILFLLPSIAHLADFRDIAQPGVFRVFPGTITRPGIARPTLVPTVLFMVCFISFTVHPSLPLKFVFRWRCQLGSPTSGTPVI